ncbi:hypothetical protein PUNSTDRAFT_142698 [Punctularia strigosozonata HHB-11173 SS5]|uniref:uncharacterized protein n=1 Tax=Punctularia strigosozonata (strain HHB-11173) TaxID=741275 RepID=UPI0004416CBF|nr:uncharacterized protein PUNSTDRAFT_142698 [Punctularia strigosozonata HHB-11173 SS5]EIN10758.1 hypothetical protein PUNSTDRAFT_142698 [Punctularia strigosozonata HHB-11173 SS5]
MESEIQQLVEMGASRTQAKAALQKHRDVMEAAEQIFEGKFDDVAEDDDVTIAAPDARIGRAEKARTHMTTPDDGSGDEIMDDEDGEEEEDDEGDDYIDYDSDEEFKPSAQKADVDPYAGIFFSKDRREEVIEIEEAPEHATIPGFSDSMPLMTQGEWMQGCPEGSEQSFLFSLYSQLSDGSCPCPHGCDFSVARQKSDFFALYPDFDTYIKELRKRVHRLCGRCHKAFCLACGEGITGEKSRTGDSTDPLFHCSNIQGVTVGIGLFMVEKLFLEQTQDNARQTEPDAKPGLFKRKKAAIDAGTPPMYDDDDFIGPQNKKAKGGIGYAGNVKEDITGQTEALAQQRAKDAKLGSLMASVRVYMPSLRRPSGGYASDYLPHPTTLAHLRRRFNLLCTTFLRNDSLADMSDRSVLYYELFTWMETISNHEALASMMAQPIMVAQSVKAAMPRKSSKKPDLKSRERTIVYEASAGPRELLESIVIQSHAAIKSLDSGNALEQNTEMTEEEKRATIDDKGKSREAGEGAHSDENQRMLDFCHRIQATARAIDRFLRENKGDQFVERLHASLPRIPTALSGDIYVDAGDTEETAKKAYMEWATRVRFEYCDLTISSPKSNGQTTDTPHYKHYYDAEARALVSSDMPKRSLAIAKELAVLTTNLPVSWDSSIFLKVDETRVDIIKALIIGPQGTPYQNGCFLFDIFLGPSYNQMSPSVKYMTTNGGKFRFNPNLYADGKVCLSLLGTWQGPGWIAGKSTLLQVLISIQSMILCDEPYLNEPGWANDAGTPQSKDYSANVRRMVVKTAMLDNLKSPPEPFEDIIRTHFRLKARSITVQLDQWLAQDDGKPTLAGGGVNMMPESASGSSTAFRRDVEELKRQLRQL